MSTPEPEAVGGERDQAEAAALVALDSIGMLLPHLSGIAQLVRLSATDRVPTAGVFPSGRIAVNPKWFSALAAPEQIFVLAHEILHLALRTHERCVGTDARLFNVAHDYIINDMLRESLGCPVPAQGLDMPGAAKRSAEEIVTDLRSQGGAGLWEAWGGARMGSLGEALARAGAAPTIGIGIGASPLLDVLDEVMERQWFPGEHAEGQERRRVQLSTEIDRALELGSWHERVQDLLRSDDQAGKAAEPPAVAVFNALRLRAQPPWQLALQRWLEDVAPGERTYARPSRRQDESGDIVLPGRRREGWTLNLILDTSGSMWEELAKVLGIVAGFCESMGIGQVRILQCSNGLEVDELVGVDALGNYRMRGGGGSDMRPGFYQLAADPNVEAAIVITDGMIHYPAEPMPYAVLWTLIGPYEAFAPAYGRVIRVQT